MTDADSPNRRAWRRFRRNRLAVGSGAFLFSAILLVVIWPLFATPRFASLLPRALTSSAAVMLAASGAAIPTTATKRKNQSSDCIGSVGSARRRKSKAATSPSARLMATNGMEAAQPKPKNPVTRKLALPQAANGFHQSRGRVRNKAATRMAVDAHRKATPPSNRVSATAASAERP